MAVLKVLEILASDKSSWEGAAQQAVKVAAQTIRDIRSVNISNQSAVVVNGKITEYRLNCKITFAVEN